MRKTGGRIWRAGEEITHYQLLSYQLPTVSFSSSIEKDQFTGSQNPFLIHKLSLQPVSLLLQRSPERIKYSWCLIKRDAMTNTAHREELHYVQAYIHSCLKGGSLVSRMPCARQGCFPKAENKNS